MSSESDRQRTLDLLADRALEGLDAAQEAELQSLLARCPVEDAELFDAIAAELIVAELQGAEAVPPELEAKLLAALVPSTALDVSPQPAPHTENPSTTSSTDRGVRWSELFAWLAVVACVVVITSNGVRWQARPIEPTLAELRTALVDEADDLVSIPWSPGPTAPEHEPGFDFGDVVWSPKRQQGFMRFRGLPTNDPTIEQYQLWMFDGTRNEAHPVDGGVFNVDSETGDVLVPITAKLDVREVTLFAITVEPPGGVVVSTRERLPLLAKVERL